MFFVEPNMVSLWKRPFGTFFNECVCDLLDKDFPPQFIWIN